MNDYNFVRKSRDKRKEEIVETMGGKCQLCGYSKCLAALELHHIDPSIKDFSFNKAKNTAWDNLVPELKKCILLCANCHREVHQNLVDVHLFSSFNEEIASEISQKIQKLKSKEIFYCKHCGATVTYGNDCCSNCSSLLKRKVERPTREELKELIRKLPFTTIAKQYGVSDNAIRKWCKKENLPFKKTEIKAFTNEQWEQI